MRNLVFATAIAVSLFLTSARAEDGRPALQPGTVGHVLISQEDPASIARLYGVSTSELAQANPELSWTEGEIVVIPTPDSPWPTHTVRAGETLWRIGKGYGISVEQLRQANNLEDHSTIFRGNVLRLPRAQKPAWTEPEPAAASKALVVEGPVEVYGTAAPRRPSSPELSGAWVEVRLPDNRRAWAPVGSLVVGAWLPQPADRVLEVGRGFVGVPYKWGGVDPNGWDCSGFVQEVFRLGGHQVPRLADAQYQACAKVEMEALQPGDLVFFNTDGSGVSHVGIYTGDRRFLHASSSRGVVEDSLEDTYFASRYYGGGRLPAWAGVDHDESAAEDVPAEDVPAED